MVLSGFVYLPLCWRINLFNKLCSHINSVVFFIFNHNFVKILAEPLLKTRNPYTDILIDSVHTNEFYLFSS